MDELAEEGVRESVELVASVDGDVLLQSMVAGAHGSETAEMGLTLTVPAGIVSGVMIGATRWFREVGERHPELAEMANELVEKEQARESREDTLWTYIHLREARILTGGRWVLTDPGFHWRGRLSQITGWSFGVFREPTPEA